LFIRVIRLIVAIPWLIDDLETGRTQSNQGRRCCLKTAAALIVLAFGVKSLNFPLENAGATID